MGKWYYVLDDDENQLSIQMVLGWSYNHDWADYDNDGD